jgi:hypothetical protein
MNSQRLNKKFIRFALALEEFTDLCIRGFPGVIVKLLDQSTNQNEKTKALEKSIVNSNYLLFRSLERLCSITPKAMIDRAI